MKTETEKAMEHGWDKFSRENSPLVSQDEEVFKMVYQIAFCAGWHDACDTVLNELHNKQRQQEEPQQWQ